MVNDQQTRPACHVWRYRTGLRMVGPDRGVNGLGGRSDAFPAIHARAIMLPMGNIPGQLRLNLEDGKAAKPRTHGERRCYISGCREAVCRAANTRYQRDYRNYRGANPSAARLPRGTIRADQ